MVLKELKKQPKALDDCNFHLDALTAMQAQKHWNSAMHARRR